MITHRHHDVADGARPEDPAGDPDAAEPHGNRDIPEKAQRHEEDGDGGTEWAARGPSVRPAIGRGEGVRTPRTAARA